MGAPEDATDTIPLTFNFSTVNLSPPGEADIELVPVN